MDEQTMRGYLLEVADRIKAETGQMPVYVGYEASTDDATTKRPWRGKMNTPCGHDWAFGSTIDELVADAVAKSGPDAAAKHVARIKAEIAERRQLLAEIGLAAKGEQ